MIRKIVKIDEEKCDGCGQCVPACAEGALQVIDGKARIVNEIYCDGLGDCLGKCPQDAISIEEREAPEFDEKAVEQYLKSAPETRQEPVTLPSLPCGCPGTALRTIERKESGFDSPELPEVESELSTWPVQLMLVPPEAPFLIGADILICADCVPFALPDFHKRFLQGRVVLVGCPKLDDLSHYQEKLEAIFKAADPSSVTVLRMEVPCCSGIVQAVTHAHDSVTPDTPIDVRVIGIQGDVRTETPQPVKSAI